MTDKATAIAALIKQMEDLREANQRLAVCESVFAKVYANLAIGALVPCSRMASGKETTGVVVKARAQAAPNGVSITYDCREVKKDGTVGSIQCYRHEWHGLGEGT